MGSLDITCGPVPLAERALNDISADTRVRTETVEFEVVGDVGGGVEEMVVWGCWSPEARQRVLAPANNRIRHPLTPLSAIT